VNARLDLSALQQALDDFEERISALEDALDKLEERIEELEKDK
jgi:predicted  nucleic acid-binding Zn-ribbon protein